MVVVIGGLRWCPILDACIVCVFLIFLLFDLIFSFSFSEDWSVRLSSSVVCGCSLFSTLELFCVRVFGCLHRSSAVLAHSQRLICFFSLLFCYSSKSFLFQFIEDSIVRWFINGLRRWPILET